MRALVLLILTCMSACGLSVAHGATREVLYVQMKEAPAIDAGAPDARRGRRMEGADPRQTHLRDVLPRDAAAMARFEALPALAGWLVSLPPTLIPPVRAALRHAPAVAFVAWHGIDTDPGDLLIDPRPPPTPPPASRVPRTLALGIIDLGADLSHPLLARAFGRVHGQPGTPGLAGDGRLVRSHGTAMAGIYAQLLTGMPLTASGFELPWLKLPRPVTLSDTLIARAGPETRAGRSDLLRALNWMMTPGTSRPLPDVINYSQGNGRLCSAAGRCRAARWTAVTQVLDRLVDEHHVTLVKSAGNHGDGDEDTMTVPGDTWNGITVGNMHAFDWTSCTPGAERAGHKIYRTSSVGPAATTLRRLDLVAPGVRITTTGVDPTWCERLCDRRQDLSCTFCARLGRHDRVRGGFWKTNSGTSPAAAVVGALALYLIDEGVRDPRAVKAVLINSADAWTSDGTPPPQVQGNGRGCRDDVLARRHGPYGHGSHYDRRYGYGYLNPAQAVVTARHARLGTVDASTPRCYGARLEPWDKLTLVWHRHAHAARPTTLDLALLDAHTLVPIDIDHGRLFDNLRQVSNGRGAAAVARARDVVVRVDAMGRERYALASRRALTPLARCPESRSRR